MTRWYAFMLSVLYGVCSCTWPAEAQWKRHVSYIRADPSVVQGRLDSFPAAKSEQIARLKRQFAQVGLGGDMCRLSNGTSSGTSSGTPSAPEGLVCTAPGKGSGTIAVVALLSSSKGQAESEMERTAPAMLPLLAESALYVERRSTYIFAALDGDDDHGKDIVGSLLGGLKNNRQGITAVVFLSQLGRADPIVGCVKKDSATQRALLDALAALRMPMSPQPEAACPGLITGLTRNPSVQGLFVTSPSSYQLFTSAIAGHIPFRVWKVDSQAYFTAYQLSSVYLAMLDNYISP